MIEKGKKYERHARRRMKWRNISESEVEKTLMEPDKIESTKEGRKNVFKMVGNKYIKVTYREYQNEILIISVMDKSD